MNELLKINYEAEQPTVSARDLHEQLHIGTKFTTWFERMKEYGFSEGKEFFPKLGETSEQGGRPQTDFQISVDMAKQICMIQRSPEGKQIRQYFIDLEKAWNTPEQIMARALKMANHSIESLKGRCKFLGEQVVEQQQIITELQPKDLSDELARIDSLVEKLGTEKESCIESYISIEKQIKEIKNEDENDVLFYRYIKGLRWWEIAEKMDCSERWVHKLHGKALGHLKYPE